MDDELLAWAPKTPTAPEITLPGYSGFHLLAQGGEGTVYRARQDGLGRDVAVKVLQVDDPATLARFQRELEITVRLGRQHPHIVTVLDTGTLPGGRPCIVMEFYDLGSLHDRLRERGPLPVADVVAAGVAVADALAFAHGQGILHRDVKPQNILVLPTSYVLADFGIARGADAGHSASLQMVSYRHAAPQMIDGIAPAAADDLWSLGSTLFTLLEGVPPFASDNPTEDTVLPYLGRVRTGEPRPLTRTDVPPDLAQAIQRCLRKERADRFPDAAALRDALTEVGAEIRRWSPVPATVDPDATAMAPITTANGHTSVVAQGPFADFGPTPTPLPEPEPQPEARPAVEESRGTMTGRLADLTVRHHPDQSTPDFGPGAAALYSPPSTSSSGPPPATPAAQSLPPATAALPAALASPPATPSDPHAHPAPTPPAAPAAPPSTPTPASGASAAQGHFPSAPPAAPAIASAPPAAPAPSAAAAHGPSSDTYTPSTAAPAPSPDAVSPRLSPPSGVTAEGTSSTPGSPDGSAAATAYLTPVAPGSQPPHGPGAPYSNAHRDQAPLGREEFRDSRGAQADRGWQRPSAGEAPYDWDLVDPDTTGRTDAEHPSAPARPRSGRRFAVAALLTAAAGVGIGVLANQGSDPVSAPTSTPVAPTTTSVPPVTTSAKAGPIAEGGDPEVRPTLTRLEDRGTSIKVNWTDPTGGRAQFILYDVTDQSVVPTKPIGVNPGETSVVVPNLDPDAKQYCYQLIAVSIDPGAKRGSSARVCAIRN